MEQSKRIIKAEQLREIIRINQETLLFKKIFEEAKNFRTSLLLISDIKLAESLVDYLRELGYKIKIEFITDRIPYKYKYEINWQ